MSKKVSPEEFSKSSLEMIKSNSMKSGEYKDFSAEDDKEIQFLIANKRWIKAEQRLLQLLQINPFDIFMRNFLTYIQIKKGKYDIAENLIQGTETLDPTDLRCKSYYIYIKYLQGQQDEVKRKRTEIDRVLHTPQSEHVANSLLYAQEIQFLEFLDNIEGKKIEDIDILLY